MRSVLDGRDVTARGRILEAALELFTAHGFRSVRISPACSMRPVMQVTLCSTASFLAARLARWADGDVEAGIARVAGPISDIYARGLYIPPSHGVDGPGRDEDQ